MIDGDEKACRMWEIAENLMRSDLTALQRAEQIAEWITLTGDEVQPAQVAPVNRGGRIEGGKPKQGGINAAVRELDIDRSEAQRAVKIAGDLTDAAKAEAQRAKFG